MQLKDVMTENVRGVDADQSVQTAAKLMDQLQVGALPVFRDSEPIGIVTDRDVAIRAVAPGLDCSQTTVTDIMTGGVVKLPDTTDVGDAARQMEGDQIRRLLVTNADGELVGIVSVGDIVAKSGEFGLSAELIQMLSLPATPMR
jgi:CBS domain-containing protein